MVIFVLCCQCQRENDRLHERIMELKKELEDKQALELEIKRMKELNETLLVKEQKSNEEQSEVRRLLITVRSWLMRISIFFPLNLSMLLFGLSSQNAINVDPKWFCIPKQVYIFFPWSHSIIVLLEVLTFMAYGVWKNWGKVLVLISLALRG